MFLKQPPIENRQKSVLDFPMQQDLIALMHEPEIAYVSGGHLSTVVKADDYIRTIRAILLPARGNDSAGFSAESSGIEDDKMFCGIRQKFDKSLYIC